MHKILMVLRREYLQSVRTKMFWIGTLLMPLMIVLLAAVSILAQFLNPQVQKHVAFLDETGVLAAMVDQRLADETLEDGRREYIIETVPPGADVVAARRQLEPRVLDDELFGIVVSGRDLDAEGNYRIYLKSVGDIDSLGTLERALEESVVGLRLERSALEMDRETLERLIAPIDLESYQVLGSGESQKKGFEQALVPTFVFVIILFMTLYFYGYAMTRGIIQEKSTRIMEVLLGSLSSEELMTGKILGIGLVGLTQIAIYTLVGGALRLFVVLRLADGDLGFLIEALSPAKLGFFLLFFLLGYFFFVSLFAIVGAVCNTEQDAQNLNFPLMLTLMLPYLMTFYFVKHPDSTAAVVTSLIPLFTPMVMFMRISVLPPPWWQIVLSIVLMLASTYVLFRAAAKVFRIGTLMYGKRPSVAEILRWARG